MKAKLYIAAPFGPQPSVRVLDPESREAVAKRNVLYKQLPGDFDLHAYERVETIAESDLVVLPQAVRTITPQWHAYYRSIRRDAQAAGKKVLLWIGRDDSHKRHVAGAIVCKGSDYRHAIQDNEFIPAPFVEDLGYGRELVPREKGTKPVVSFCGYAGFPSWKNHARYLVKNAVLEAVSFITRNPEYLVYKRGIYFRRRSMRILERDPRIVTNFIKRQSFSANRATVESAADIRTEYIENMLGSDFVLAPKGDANFSSRFYEALSLGKVPILIDTDMPMPLSQEINYDEFTIRIQYTDLHRIADIVSERFMSLTGDEYVRMQRRAREVFLSHLRFDSYWNRALPLLVERGVSALQ